MWYHTGKRPRFCKKRIIFFFYMILYKEMLTSPTLCNFLQCSLNMLNKISISGFIGKKFEHDKLKTPPWSLKTDI